MLFFSSCAFGLVMAATKTADSNWKLPSIARGFVNKVFINSCIGQPSSRHCSRRGEVGRGGVAELKLVSQLHSGD